MKITLLCAVEDQPAKISAELSQLFYGTIDQWPLLAARDREDDRVRRRRDHRRLEASENGAGVDDHGIEDSLGFDEDFADRHGGKASGMRRTGVANRQNKQIGRRGFFDATAQASRSECFEQSG